MTLTRIHGTKYKMCNNSPFIEINLKYEKQDNSGYIIHDNMLNMSYK